MVMRGWPDRCREVVRSQGCGHHRGRKGQEPLTEPARQHLVVALGGGRVLAS